MNKIKAHFQHQDFTPWEESFQNVFASLQQNKHRQPLKERVKKPNKERLSLRKQKSKEAMSKTLLNISKVNLHNTATYYPQQVNRIVKPQIESTRYAGPRVSFYSKMNPRASGRSKSTLDPQSTNSSAYQMLKKQLTGRLTRDSSIKYLQIIDEKEQNKKLPLPQILNLNRGGAYKSHKNDEQHTYLRQLKMIYSTRKH